MKLYIIKEKKEIYAEGEYDPKTKKMIVYKGSKLSKDIAHSATFRGAKSIEKYRTGIVKNNVLTENISFKSSSTAANFVTGRSSNGFDVWKNKDGISLKELTKHE